ncbi:MAG: hypothetical protein PHX61_14395 [Alphaproteobacteria bacterium]|nr:hypothetical protein [Alphaproteobacteria bacterium]
MTITKLEAFKTSDDTLFTNYEEALTHESKLDLEAWYEDNQLMVERGVYIEWEDVRDWLIETGLFETVATAVLTRTRKEN